MGFVLIIIDIIIGEKTGRVHKTQTRLNAF